MTADVLERVDQPDLRPRLPRRRLAVGAVAWLPALLTAGWALIRLAGAERGVPMVQLEAFTTWVAAASAVPPLLALGLRRWWAAGLAAVAAVALVACVLPRMVADSSGVVARGPVLRVMSCNMRFGEADAATIVALVREYRVDVLALQELTSGGERALERAGLAALLPSRVTLPMTGAGGSGVFARVPLRRDRPRPMPGGFLQAAVTIAAPGAVPVAMESVHTYAPVSRAVVRDWEAGLAGQPAATPRGTVRLLVGDFNATLDHVALRRLVATGYRDAGDVLGAGLVSTWPYDGRSVPKVTIDHVLADPRIGIRALSAHRVPDTDHRALVAELVLPTP